MNERMTAGEFGATTGLTPKALRLYAERSILEPAAIDPGTGYRSYGRNQIGRGVILDLLRRSQVPLEQLSSTDDFDFDTWRSTVAVRRIMEDFMLDVAERVAAFDPGRYTAHPTRASRLDWVGILVDIGIPDDAEARIGTFAELSATTPEIEEAFLDSVANMDDAATTTMWTAASPAVAQTSTTRSCMLIARPTSMDYDRSMLADIEDSIRRRTGTDVIARTGSLPSRTDITFTLDGAAREPAPIDEATEDYLHLLAFENYCATEGLTAVGTARRVTDGGSLFCGSAIRTVFSALPSSAGTIRTPGSSTRFD